MKLKSKPKLVKRRDVKHRIDLPCDIIVFDILGHCVGILTNRYGYIAEELQLLSDHDINLDYGRGYYDEVELYAEFTTLESITSWNTREQAYLKKLDVYNTWLLENAEDIAEEITQREAQQAIDFRNKTQREVDTLATKLAAGQARLKKMGVG